MYSPERGSPIGGSLFLSVPAHGREARLLGICPKRSAPVPIAVLAAVLVGGCDTVGPPQREVTVTGTVYFDHVPDSGWTLALFGPSSTSSSGSCLGLCGGGWGPHVADAVSGADGTYAITALVEDDFCDRMSLQFFAPDWRVGRTEPEGHNGRQIPCGLAEGYDYNMDSSWPN